MICPELALYPLCFQCSEQGSIPITISQTRSLGQRKGRGILQGQRTGPFPRSQACVLIPLSSAQHQLSPLLWEASPDQASAGESSLEHPAEHPEKAPAVQQSQDPKGIPGQAPD